MVIGVLAVGFNCAEYFDQVLEPWLKYKEKHSDLIISVVSALFKENQTTIKDDSQTLMKHALDKKQIDYLALPTGKFDEAAIRNFALTPLLNEKVDYVILLDFDEIYTLDQIEKIFQFVEKEPFVIWFKIRFKNYVIDKKYYTLDFCPPRLFKTENLVEAYYDNDFNYSINGTKVSYKIFPSMEIPVITVDHYSWIGSPERLKQKLRYQNKRWSSNQIASLDGDGCSYKWNSISNKLELNPLFFKKHNIIPPLILCD